MSSLTATEDATFDWWREHAHAVRRDIIRIFNNGSTQWPLLDLLGEDAFYSRRQHNTDFACVVESDGSELLRDSTQVVLTTLSQELTSDWAETGLELRKKRPEERALFPDFLLACLVLESFRCRRASDPSDRLKVLVESYLWDHIECELDHSLPTSTRARQVLAEFLQETKTRLFIVPSPSSTEQRFAINPGLTSRRRRVILSGISRLSNLFQHQLVASSQQRECAAEAEAAAKDHQIFVLQVAEAAINDSYTEIQALLTSTSAAALVKRCCGPDGRGLLITTIQSEELPNPFGFTEPVPLTLLALRLRARTPSSAEGVKGVGAFLDIALRQFGFRRCLEVFNFGSSPGYSGYAPDCIALKWPSLLHRKEEMTQTAFRNRRASMWSKLGRTDRWQYEYLRHYASVDRYLLRVSLLLASAPHGNGTLKALTFDVRGRVMSYVYGDFSLPKRFLRKRFKFPSAKDPDE